MTKVANKENSHVPTPVMGVPSESWGRMSALHPEIQNVPIRTSLGREIREAFRTLYSFDPINVNYAELELIHLRMKSK